MRLKQRYEAASFLLEDIAEGIALCSLAPMVIAWCFIRTAVMTAVIWFGVSVAVLLIAAAVLGASNVMWRRACSVIAPVTAEQVRRACIHRDHVRINGWEHPARGADFVEVGYIGRHEKRK